MKTFSLLLCAFVLTSVVANASPATGEEVSPEAQVASGLPLPYWEEGEFRDNFDVRMWPRSVVIWLEEENLRSLIADPATPDAERQSLKRILAMQRAWRVHG